MLASAANRFETPLPAGAICPATRRRRRPTAAAPTTPTCSAPTGAGARPRATTRSRGRRSRPRYRTDPRARSPTASRSSPARSRRAARCTSARRAARTGSGAPGSTSPGATLEFNDLGYLERKNDYQALPRRSTTGRSTLVVARARRGPALQRQPARDARRPRTVERDQAGRRQVDAHELLVALLQRPRPRPPTSTIARRATAPRWNAPPSAGVSADIATDPRRPLTGWSAVDASTCARRRRHLRRERAHLAARAVAAGAGAAADRRLRERRAPLRREGQPSRPGAGRSRTSSAPRPRPASARRCAPPTPSRPSCRCSCTRSCSSRASTTIRCSRSRSRRAAIVRLADLEPLRRAGRCRARCPTPRRATLNVNVVLRWEYRLGSTLFLVYTRAQNPALTPSPERRELRAAAAAPGPRRRQRAHAQARLLVRLTRRAAGAELCGRATAKPPHAAARGARIRRAAADSPPPAALAPGCNLPLRRMSRPQPKKPEDSHDSQHDARPLAPRPHDRLGPGGDAGQQARQQAAHGRGGPRGRHAKEPAKADAPKTDAPKKEKKAKKDKAPKGDATKTEGAKEMKAPAPAPETK